MLPPKKKKRKKKAERIFLKRFSLLEVYGLLLSFLRAHSHSACEHISWIFSFNYSAVAEVKMYINEHNN